MNERDDGIILRTRPLTETSLIVHWLTASQGRLSTVAKGARRTKSQFKGKLDLFFESEIFIQPSRRSDLHTLKEVQTFSTHDALRRNINSLNLLAHGVQLIEKTTETEAPLPGIHAIVSSLLGHLDDADVRPALVYGLEIKLLNELGLGPALNEQHLSQSARELLEQMAALHWRAITKLKPTRKAATEAGNFLQQCWAEQLGFQPKLRAELVAV